VPLVVKGNTLGLAKLKEQVSLQPNTQRIVRLNGPKINEQSIFLVEPILNEIGLVSIAQENAHAANIDAPCYVTGEGQGDYPKPNDYRNEHRRYSADRIRASPTNFLSGRNNGRTKDSHSWNESFAQNNRGGNVKNHHHQNLSDSLVSKPLIKHTYDELEIQLTNTRNYDYYGDMETATTMLRKGW